MVFRNLKKKTISLALFNEGKQIERALSFKFFGVSLTPQWTEYCERLVGEANKRIYQVWQIIQLSIDADFRSRPQI